MNTSNDSLPIYLTSEQVDVILDALRLAELSQDSAALRANIVQQWDEQQPTI